MIGTFAGGGLPRNASANLAGLGTVEAVAVDSSGNLYLALPDYHIVVRDDMSTGILTLVAGNGTAGYSGDNGAATSAQLSYPSGLAVDAAGNLYISDVAKDVVRKVSNGEITTVAGTGAYGFTGDGGPAASAKLAEPHGLAIDGNQNLYIADSGNLRIREVSNGTITTVAGDGQPSPIVDGVPATSSSVFLPVGVAVDSGGNLYISDNSGIRMVHDGIISTLASGIRAWGIAVDAKGNLYTADYGQQTVHMTADGAVTVVAGNGIAGVSGDGLAATKAELNGPAAVAVDASGNLYIADSKNMRVRMVSSGIISTVAGAEHRAGDGGPPAAAQFYSPSGIAFDSSGNLYIADTYNHVIREVSGGTINTIAGTGAAGFTGDGGPATSAELNGPMGIAVDAAGNVYIADTGNAAIREISNGVITTIVKIQAPGVTQPASPSALALDASGNLYIAATYSFTGYSPFPGGPIQVCGYELLRLANGATTKVGEGRCIPANPSQILPTLGLATDSKGNLFVADGISSVYEIANGAMIHIAGAGVGFAGDNGPAQTAQLSSPSGVAVDSSGDIWIADTANQRIRKISKGMIATVAGLGPPPLQGLPTFGGDGGPAIAAQLSNPQAILVNSDGEVLFADTGNDRIRVLIPSNSCASAVNLNSYQIAGAGGSLTTDIQTPASCSWTISNLPQWIKAAGVSGVGSATITLSVAANPGPQRVATIAIAGQNITITQGPAIYTVSGQITFNGQPLPGVDVALYDSRVLIVRTQSDTNGNYSLRFSAVAGVLGPLSPTLAGYNFVPEIPGIFGLDNGVFNFTAWLQPQIANATPLFVSTLQPVSPSFAAREIIAIHGSQLCLSEATAAPPLPTELGGCEVTLNSQRLALYSVSPGQITAVLPQTGDSVADLMVSRFTDATYTQIAAYNDITVVLMPDAMAFLERNDNGNAMLAAQYMDGDLVGSARPLMQGDLISLYLTGLGRTKQTFPEGVAAGVASEAVWPIQISVGGVPAQILYAGLQPGYPGLDQVVLRVPEYSIPASQSTVAIDITAPEARQNGQILHYELPARGTQ